VGWGPSKRNAPPFFLNQDRSHVGTHNRYRRASLHHTGLPICQAHLDCCRGVSWRTAANAGRQRRASCKCLAQGGRIQADLTIFFVCAIARRRRCIRSTCRRDCPSALRIHWGSHAMRGREIRNRSLHSKGKAAGTPSGLSRERATSVVALSVIGQTRQLNSST
jgi:hypothetical protein